MLGPGTADRIRGHLREQRLPRLLDDGGATLPPDEAQSAAAVVARAGEDDADHPLLVGRGCATKQRIDRRAVSALFRSTAQPDSLALHHQVAIGSRHVDEITED